MSAKLQNNSCARIAIELTEVIMTATANRQKLDIINSAKSSSIITIKPS